MLTLRLRTGTAMGRVPLARRVCREMVEQGLLLKNKTNTALCRSKAMPRGVGKHAVTTMKTATSKSEEARRGGDSGHPLL